MRKQANGKAVRKHMRNGGMHSFNFHSSPRMVRSFKKIFIFLILNSTILLSQPKCFPIIILIILSQPIYIFLFFG